MARATHIRRPIGATLACLALAAPALAASAQPTVRVRAATRLELEAERLPGAIRISGAVLDDLDRPLADRALIIRARPQAEDLPSRRVQVHSDAAGRFSVDLELPLGRYRITAVHPGDVHHTGAERAVPLDLTRAPVKLRIVEPRTRRLRLGEGAIALTVEASSSEGGADLEVRVEDELGRSLLHGRTDARGRPRGRLSEAQLGEPGLGRLTAHSEGDARRLPGRGSRTVVRYLATELDLEAGANDGTLWARGHLGAGNRGLERRAVGLYLDGGHLATVLTDARGRFEYRHRPRESQTGPRSLEARFESNAPWWGSSNAGPITLPLDAAPPPSPLWLLVPFLWIAAVLRWLASRDRGEPAAVTSPGANAPPVGVVAGEPRLSLRPTHYRVGGAVLDAASSEPIAGARVELEGPGAGHLRADAGGRFQSNDLPAGRYRLRVAAPGFASEEAQLTIPHRGEWASLRVGLESLRARAVRAYRPVAEAVLPEPRLWERWTLREVLGSAQHASPIPPDRLQALSGRVERAAYARPDPSPEEVDRIAAQSEQLLDPLPGAGGSVPPAPTDDP